MVDETTKDAWATLTYDEKNRILFQKQKELLDTFLEKGAISKEQLEKILHDLADKTGFTE